VIVRVIAKCTPLRPRVYRHIWKITKGQNIGERSPHYAFWPTVHSETPNYLPISSVRMMEVHNDGETIED
jgi:hypothetical protein